MEIQAPCWQPPCEEAVLAAYYRDLAAYHSSLAVYYNGLAKLVKEGDGDLAHCDLEQKKPKQKEPKMKEPKRRKAKKMKEGAVKPPADGLILQERVKAANDWLGDEDLFDMPNQVLFHLYSFLPSKLLVAKRHLRTVLAERAGQDEVPEDLKKMPGWWADWNLAQQKKLVGN